MTTKTLAVLLVVFAMVAAPAIAQDPPAPTPTPAPTPAPTPTQPAPTPAPTPEPKQAAAPATTFESVKIICDGKVKSDGASSLIFTPAGGEAKEIRVTLMKGMGRGDACRDLAKELQVGLGGTPYGVNLYDADKIKIAGQNGAKFGLTLGSSSVTGLTIALK